MIFYRGILYFNFSQKLTEMKSLLIISVVYLLVQSSCAGCPNDCSDHGKCDSDDNVCKCDDRYTDDDCSHKQKSKLTAFLVEFLVGAFLAPGAGMIYIDRIGEGIGLMILRWAAYLMVCVGMCCIGMVGGLGSGLISTDSRFGKICGGGLTGLAVCGMVVLILLWFGAIFGSLGWWLSNWIRILTDDIDDGDGFPLWDDM